MTESNKNTFNNGIYVHILEYNSTFKVSKSQILAAIVLNHSHSVHNDGSSEEMGQYKDVCLLQSLAWLVGQVEHSLPVLPQLVLIQTVALGHRQTLFRLLPTIVEPVQSESWYHYAKHTLRSLEALALTVY